MNTSRRQFLVRSSAATAGFLGLRALVSPATAQTTGTAGNSAVGTATAAEPWKMPRHRGFGELVRDPAKVFDLPEGFSYRIISRRGEEMDDGLLVPGSHDGMAAFQGEDGRVLLVCNHEISPQWYAIGAFGAKNERKGKIPAAQFYDAGTAEIPHQGGTTTIVYNPRTLERERIYLSLAGTERNCAGGPTPWGSWITCEETSTKAGDGSAKDHGYNFEVPAHADIKPADPVPLVAMGRFRHEAIAVEPRSGIVFQTEDTSDSLIYRFIPNVPGQLREGGKLQALAIKGEPTRDTRNWPELDATPFPGGEVFEVEWIDMDEVESPDDDLRHRGAKKGAALFARGEGMWYGNGDIYFACTNGGAAHAGQIFRYIPSPFEGSERENSALGRLELFVESSDTSVLENADNLTVAPWGDLLVCEDADQPCSLVGVTPDGEYYEFGRNDYTGSELAGACFSPDGETLFVNIQGNGVTLAITGPWDRRFQA
jgi:secreted PhoX family phosphatase